LVNGAIITGATNATFTQSNFANLDVVTCQVTSSGVCSGYQGSGSATVHVSNVGVKPLVLVSGDLIVIPNPNNGQFSVKGNISNALSSGSNDQVTLEVTNVIGQVLFSKEIKSTNGMVNEQIDLGKNVANGMYLLSVTTDTDKKVFHIVVAQ
jgi:hypothetical protein